MRSGDQHEVVGPGLDAAADAVDDGAAGAQRARGRAGDARGDEFVPARGRRLFDRRAIRPRTCARATPPSRRAARPPRSTTRSPSTKARSGGSHVDAPPAERRRDRLERGRRRRPSDANPARAMPRSSRGPRAGPERGGHRREPGRGDARRVADARDLLRIGNAPQLGEQRTGVDELGVRCRRGRAARSPSASCRRRRRGARRARRRSR